MNTSSSRMMSFIAATVCVVAFGCRENPAPPTPPEPLDAAAPAKTPDENVLQTLDFYEPMYKIDATGRITHLRLSGRHVPTTLMAEVGKLTELQGLDLYGTTVNDEGLAKLKDLQKLRSIGLGATQITDKGLLHLEKLQSLHWTWVPKQTVTKAGVDKLKSERPDLNVYLQ